jgi:hypothetical protein
MLPVSPPPGAAGLDVRNCPSPYTGGVWAYAAASAATDMADSAASTDMVEARADRVIDRVARAPRGGPCGGRIP